MHNETHNERGSEGPRFDVAVPDDGYRWWYVDGLSDDGRSGIVVIAFVGSVFSPYYFAARQRGPADPEDYVAINVGLYRPRGKLWAMTERGRSALRRDRESFEVGPSRVRWDGTSMRIDIAERSMPFGRRVAGRITVRPEGLNTRVFELDEAGRHTWQPIAPLARIEVAFERPAWFWQGNAYVDTNAGQRPLERDFHSWHWSRGSANGKTTIDYAVTAADRSQRSLALRFGPAGEHESLASPALVDLPSTGWRIRRRVQSDSVPVVERTLEDTPFYARSVLNNPGDSTRPRHVMHESLSLERFSSTWVRTLLPFRMPRLR